MSIRRENIMPENEPCSQVLMKRGKQMISLAQLGQALKPVMMNLMLLDGQDNTAVYADVEITRFDLFPEPTQHSSFSFSTMNAHCGGSHVNLI